MEVKKIMVLGAGIMGSGIAQVCAQAEISAILVDINEELVKKGMKSITSGLEKLVSRKRITSEDKEAILSRIILSTDKSAGKDVEVVIEAIPEVFEIKKETLEELDKICPSQTIFASNTSSISITKLASTTSRPDKFIGMHFFNPVPLMRGLEIIRGYLTSEETFNTIMELGAKLKKQTIAAQDFPAFLANRIGVPLINEAIFALWEGIGTKEDIDKAMKVCFNHPMGPLQLADLVGLDTLLHVLEVMYEGFKESKYRPCPLLKQMVDAGCLGRKTGRGFYEYGEE
ncbi:MAG: 3-hydroxybutyryl-CoA dehydrogenase [Armatimonadetes bacterium CG07_land_8_20_14_0_80_40_9]|nr:MAG: 3-hydroxybutyryl-CoA dehydrogenase [Armatimonadetes bacterium CG07_land_8_20_14_0_80_40_9]